MSGLIKRLFRIAQPSAPKKPQRARLAYDPSEIAAVYAIGDVHGCYEQLIEIERRIVSDGDAIEGRKLIVLLGDYVDRGPRSSEVLDHLCLPPPEGFERIAICGNHDEAFLEFLTVSQPGNGWLNLGGQETLHSYGVDFEYLMRYGRVADVAAAARYAVPVHHIEFLRAMPVALSIGDLVFVHAGIKPGVPMREQTEEDLMWIREPFLSQGPGLPILVIHGHTPDHKPVFGNDRICIDTAAYATGNLTALKIAQGNLWIL